MLKNTGRPTLFKETNMKITKETLKQLIKEELSSIQESGDAKEWGTNLDLQGNRYEIISPEGLVKARVGPEDVIQVLTGRYMNFSKFKIGDLLQLQRMAQQGGKQHAGVEDTPPEEAAPPAAADPAAEAGEDRWAALERTHS